ncbi:MAG: pyridoxamine 5'-phosphate oxidase family protein [Alphaproteobacteria bacterium]|nr:pyridoxamine 5'-phosphate oxidase family protein [Alphaproteobacteria bacterium]
MAKFYDRLEDKHLAFIQAQKMFFVATAPLSDAGRVNLSPKGYDSFRVIGPNRVAYADLGGSGAETLAHVRENGRITFMFCSYEGPANIMRLYGRGEVMQFNDPGFAEEIAKFPPGHERARDIIFADITQVQDSCGWGVPFYEFKGQRDQLTRYIDHQDIEAWRESRLERNATSIDGLPGLIRPKAAE